MDWALVVTTPNAEKRAVEEMSRKNFPVRFFKRRLPVVHRGKLVHKEIPAFPRYLFVPFSKCWDVVCDIRDVISVVAFDRGLPARVRATTLDRLVSMCAGGDILIEPEKPARFHPGDDVLVHTGDSLIIQRGKYHRACDDGRAIVLLDWLGRECFVSVSENDLREVRSAVRARYKRRRRNGNRHRRRQVVATDALCPAT